MVAVPSIEHEADQRAWDSALRPKQCLLTIHVKLRKMVASKLSVLAPPEPGPRRQSTYFYAAEDFRVSTWPRSATSPDWLGKKILARLSDLAPQDSIDRQRSCYIDALYSDAIRRQGTGRTSTGPHVRCRFAQLVA
jgi:hypothetical protein